ncbi:aldo/keto reductase [Jatrophihabitans sp.]|uniref:aldo/keto reductase n=1 Tax=Jatrophihabitans sp. TaxID=1932789 RepID=UPI0030C6FB1A|nr:oxidoreductase [Jatrophihabitans sp.]
MDEQTITIGGELVVGRIGLGAMRLTGEALWGPYADHEGAVDFLRAAVEAGVTLIDTADVYGPHSNEHLIHDALQPYPDGLVVASKGGFVRGSRDFSSVQAIGARSYLQQAARLSARRLGVERIDLYYLHSGHATDASFEDQIETLVGLRDDGVIGHIGLSNISVEQFSIACGITEIAAVTAHFNVADRTNEPLLRAAEAAGSVFVPWQPISLIPPRDERTDVNGPDHLRAVLEPIAEAHGASASQVSLAWLLQHSPAMLPIPGTTSIEHLRQNLAAQNFRLTPEEATAITELAS